MEEVATLEDLGEEGRLILFNEHAKITALIESREKDRLICTRVEIVGTHRSALECLTVAEIGQQRELARRQVRDIQKGGGSRPEGGGGSSPAE